VTRADVRPYHVKGRLLLSFYLHLASGASIVLVETVCFVVALVVGPKTGLLSRAAQRDAVAPS
jgi:hypothetical protein